MTDEMAERTLVPVSLIRAVMGDEMLVARGCREAAADRLDAGGVATWGKVSERLAVACARLGVGRPSVLGADLVDWED